MAYNVYSTAFLLGAYGVIDRPQPFILNTFFKSEIQFETQEVIFDKVERARRLAPYVSPHVAGEAERLRGYTAASFKPGYVKSKHVLEPSKTLARRPGESLAGDLSMEDRREQIILDNLQIEDAQITRLEEVMAISLLTTGSLTMSGPDFPTQVIDMQRPSGNTVTLSGASAWGQTGVDPMDNLQTWNSYIQQVSGYAATTAIMDPIAYDLFRRSVGVALVMNSFRQTSGNIDLGGTAVGGIGNEARYQGNIGGIDIWVYQGWYTDASGNVLPLLPANTVIMGNPDGCQGTRLYGAIQDTYALKAVSRFPKMWVQEDPSLEFMMTQSAPLPVLGWSEATFCATVA